MQKDDLIKTRNSLLEQRKAILNKSKEYVNEKHQLKYDLIVAKNESNDYSDYKAKKIECKKKSKALMKTIKKELKSLKVKYNHDQKEYVTQIKILMKSCEKNSDQYYELSSLAHVYENVEYNDALVAKLAHQKKVLKAHITKMVHNKEADLVKYAYDKAEQDKKEIAILRLEKRYCNSDLKKAYKIVIGRAKDRTFVRSQKSSWRIWYAFVEWLKYRFTEEKLYVGRDIITAFSAISLALSLNYIRAIKLISKSSLGILMFGFILFGLISVFNVVRLKEAYSKKFYFTTLILFASIACGIAMDIICVMNVTIKANVVYQGVIVSLIMIFGYLIGFIFLLLARLKEIAKYKKEANA